MSLLRQKVLPSRMLRGRGEPLRATGHLSRLSIAKVVLCCSHYDALVSRKLLDWNSAASVWPLLEWSWLDARHGRASANMIRITFACKLEQDARRSREVALRASATCTRPRGNPSSRSDDCAGVRHTHTHTSTRVTQLQSTTSWHVSWPNE